MLDTLIAPGIRPSLNHLDKVGCGISKRLDASLAEIRLFILLTNKLIDTTQLIV